MSRVISPWSFVIGVGASPVGFFQMAFTSLEKLNVYRLAERLADAIWKIVVDWDYFLRDTVGKQMVRSADSTGANIAEGTGQGSFPSNRRYVRTARGSLYETRQRLRL